MEELSAKAADNPKAWFEKCIIYPTSAQPVPRKLQDSLNEEAENESYLKSIQEGSIGRTYFFIHQETRNFYAW